MKPNKLLYFMFALSLVMVGMIDHSRGLLIPQFRQAFDMSAGEIGMLFSFTSLLYVAGVYLVGRLIPKISYKPNLIMGILTAIAGFFLLFRFGVRAAFVAGMCLTVFSTAQLAILVNISVPKLHIRNHTVIINIMHFMYGISATVTQKVVGQMLERGIAYNEVYFYLLVFFALFLPLAFYVKFEEDRQNPLQKNTIYDVDELISQGDMPQEEEPGAKIPEVITDYSPEREKRLTLIFIVVMGMYIAAEAQTANWFYTYIIESFGKSPKEATDFTSAFFLCLTFGRLFGGFVVEKIGHMKSILYSFCIACSMYLIGIVTGQTGLLFIGVSGFFFSIIYPIFVLCLGRYFKDSARASSVIISGASAVNMVANSAMGFLNDLIGISRAMYFIPLCMGIAITLMMHVKRRYGFKL